MFVSYSSRGALNKYWYAVARSSDLEDKPLGVRVLDKDLVIWRGPSGSAIAAPDRCSHRMQALQAGVVVDGCLVCPQHGWTFGEGGRCVKWSGKGEMPEKAHLATFACEERSGLVWVCLAEPVQEVPVVPAEGEASFRRVDAPLQTWRAPAPRVIRSLLALADAAGASEGFQLPFTYVGSNLTGAGSEVVRMVACTPTGGSSSVVALTIWTNGGEISDEELLASDPTCDESWRRSVEEDGWSLELDGPEEIGTGSAATWCGALLASVARSD